MRTGLEPATPGVTGRYSNQLNYRTIVQTFEPMEGIEPTTPRLQITCSGQLSYIGERAANVQHFIKLPNIHSAKSKNSLNIFQKNQYYVLQGTIVFIYLCDTLLHQDIYNMDRLGNTASFLGDDHEKAVRELEKGYRLGNIAWFLGDDHEKAVRELK